MIEGWNRLKIAQGKHAIWRIHLKIHWNIDEMEHIL